MDYSQDTDNVKLYNITNLPVKTSCQSHLFYYVTTVHFNSAEPNAVTASTHSTRHWDEYFDDT